MSTTVNAAPLVTVLMSCFNAAHWLRESVGSVLEQTFSEFEFVIVDDGSTDDSLAILRTYAERDKRLVVVSKSNTGLADSLNVGLRCARGEWIARMDADDICELARLEKQVTYIRLHLNAVFVGTGLTIIDERGCAGANFIYPAGHQALLNNLLYARRFPPHASAFYRRELVLGLGGYRGRIRRAEDYDLWLRLSERGGLGSIQEPLMRIRKHSGQISLTAGGRDQMLDCRLAIISYLLRRAGVADPLDADESSYLFFVDWVKTYLQSADYFNYCEWKGNLRSNKIINTLGNVLQSKFQPRYLSRFAKEKLMGDRFAFSACNRWLRQARHG